MSGFESLPARFFALAQRLEAQCWHRYRVGATWIPVGWSSAARLVSSIAVGLRCLGHRPGDAVAIASATRREWLQVDLAVQASGGITVGLFPNLDAAEVEYVLAHSRAKICVVDRQARLENVLAVVDALPALEVIVVLDGAEQAMAAGRVQILGLDAVIARGAERDEQAEIERAARAIGPADAASFLYTSGTTGAPKGAMFSHGAIAAAIAATRAVPLLPSDSSFSLLPLSHALQRVFDYRALWEGLPMAYARGPATAIADLAAVSPSVMVAPPRMLQAIYNAVHEQAASSSSGRSNVIDWALGIAKRAQLARPGRLLAAQLAVAKRLVFDKVAAYLGGRMRLIITGGAAVTPQLQALMNAAGITVLESWGMSETFAVGCMNLPADARVGTVGRPLPGIIARTGEDDELLVRGGNLFSGYFRDDEATALAFTGDGFFRTGDLARIDEDGFVRVVDRKSDLIVTIGGAQVAPSNIERHISTDPRIRQVVVLGHRRPFLVALVAVTEEVRAELEAEELSAVVESIIGRKNLDLARDDQVRKFRMLPYELSTRTGELTPTLTIKRWVVAEKFRYLIDEMYE